MSARVTSSDRSVGVGGVGVHMWLWLVAGYEQSTIAVLMDDLSLNSHCLSHSWLETIYSPSCFISIWNFLTCRRECESVWDLQKSITVISLFQRHERECHNKLSAPKYFRLENLITQLSSLVDSAPANSWRLLCDKWELHGVSRFHLESDMHFERTMNI